MALVWHQPLVRFEWLWRWWWWWSVITSAGEHFIGFQQWPWCDISLSLAGDHFSSVASPLPSFSPTQCSVVHYRVLLYPVYCIISFLVYILLYIISRTPTSLRPIFSPRSVVFCRVSCTIQWCLALLRCQNDCTVYTVSGCTRYQKERCWYSAPKQNE